MELEEVLTDVELLGCSLIEITGGEPLLQEGVSLLVERLIQKGNQVLIETNGTLDISVLPPQAIRIMDLKCPDSGMAEKMDWRNIERLRREDEVKFVLSSRRDYEWAREVIDRYRLTEKAKVLMGVAYGRLEPRLVADWILEDAVNVRFQLQLHRYIWPPGTQEGLRLRSSCRYEKESSSGAGERGDG